jgi:hypothetical protein
MLCVVFLLCRSEGKHFMIQKLQMGTPGVYNLPSWS